MKLKTNNAAKKSANGNKNKSPNKPAKGVEVRKEKSKVVVKPTVLKTEAEKTKVAVPPNPARVLEQQLWNKAIINVSNMSTLSDEESSIVKLLVDYKKSNVPLRKTKLSNFILKGFSKFKDTSADVLDGIHSKLLKEFITLGGKSEAVGSKKAEAKANKTKSKKEVSTNEEVDDEDEENGDGDDDVDEDDDDDDEVDDAEGIMFDDSDDDIDNDEDISDEEKPKPKAKGNKANNKNGKSQPNKAKQGSKFKGGKIQKNKKFGKKK